MKFNQNKRNKSFQKPFAIVISIILFLLLFYIQKSQLLSSVQPSVTLLKHEKLIGSDKEIRDDSYISSHDHSNISSLDCQIKNDIGSIDNSRVNNILVVSASSEIALIFGKVIQSITRQNVQLHLSSDYDDKTGPGSKMITVTEYPFRSTEKDLDTDRFDQIIYVSIDDFDILLQLLMRQYQIDYQTKLGVNSVKVNKFKDYLVSKMKQIQIHQNYWMKHGSQVVKLSNILSQSYNQTFDTILELQQDFKLFLKSDCSKQLFQLEYQNFASFIQSLSKFGYYLSDNLKQHLKIEFINFGNLVSDDVNILSTFFISDYKARQNELDFVLNYNYNLNNTKLHIWTENKTELQKEIKKVYNNNVDDLIAIESSIQPLYISYFKYAQTYLKNQIVIIQNSDIVWSQESIDILRKHLSAAPLGTVYALSRHQESPEISITQCGNKFQDSRYNENLCLNYYGSHDVFAFIPPVDPMIYRQLAFKQNTWGAENVVIEAFRHSGWTVKNPCMDIKVYHAHCSNKRKATGQRIHPPDQGQRRSLRKNSVEYPKPLQ